MLHRNKKQRRFLSGDGFTIIEAAAAMTALLLIALGTMFYQYFTALHSHAAATQLTAIRTAQLLADSWKSTGGSAAYDPTEHHLGFSDNNLDGIDYEITVDDLPMYMKLSYDDVEHDEEAQITLRKITIQVNWRNDHKVPAGRPEESSMELSTFVRVDASGG